MARKDFYKRTASGHRGFVQRVNNDEIPVTTAVDYGAQRVGKKVVEEFSRVFEVDFSNLRQREQNLAVVGKPCCKLESNAADHSCCVAVVRFVPFDELSGDDGIRPGMG